MTSFDNFPGPEQLSAWLADRLPPNEKAFSEIVRAYIAHSDKNAFLWTLAALEKEVELYDSKKRQPVTKQVDFRKLAETLLLFTDILLNDGDQANTIRQLHQHYIINTEGPIPLWEADDAFDVFEWAREYAAPFNITLARHTNENGREETLMTIDDPAHPIRCEAWGRITGWSSAWSLRQVGHLINQCRYGRFDVLPCRLFPFEQEAGTYSKANAMWLAELSNLVYRNEEYVTAQLGRWGFESVQWIEDQQTDTQAFVAVKDDCLVVSFRGTMGTRDLLTDILFRKVAFQIDPEASDSAGKVHRGFLAALDSVWEQVRAVVNKLGPTRPIFVTGHSLGAALAQLAAMRLAANGQTVTAVYLFGSPRVGDADFVAAYNKRLAGQTYLHINHTDIVATIPPGWLGFRHVGQPARRFDAGHQFLAAAGEPEPLDMTPGADEEAATRQRIEQAAQAIAAANAYLNISDLTQPVQGLTYSADFEAGRVDDHGIAQYLFKFACSIVDDKFETMQG
jgi:pimeloyl-ACP methyl ester carboxylesterase